MSRDWDADLSFSDLAKFCNKVVSLDKKDQRLAKLQSFLKFSRQKSGPANSLFPVLRLILPQIDNERGAYGIKESVLALLFVRVLGLGANSVDALKLKNYRAPKGKKE